MLLLNMFRNLMKNKVQFFSIFMMSFLGLFTFVGLDSEVTGFTFAEGSYYTQQNLGDLYLFDRNFSADDEKMIENLPEVNSASRRIKVSGKAVLPENNKDADMEMNFIEEDEISKLLIKDGVPYSSGDGGVWLDYIFAEKNNIKIGDTVSLKYEDSTWSEIVRGTVMHPEHLYFLQDVAQMMPSYGTYGFCYMDVKENPDPEMITFSEMAVDLKDIDNLNPLTDEEKDHISRIGEKISDILDRDTLAFYDKNGLLSYQTFRSEMDQHKAMSFMFPVVFILISMLGIITTMTRLTARQRVQIGTLKALGLSKRVITLHYVSYGFFLSLAGSLAGAAAGYKYIVDMIVDMMKQTYLLPNAGGRLSYNSIFIIIAEVVIASFVSYLSCRRELSPPPAETLRPASPKNLKPSAFEKSALWNSFSFSTQWNLRDIKRNKARTGMGIIGVAGCTMLMLAAFGCLDSINFITDWMYGELNTCSY
ncbi:MAG: FtsX-like permease family protein, partial [Lachnospiraceae bacterium]|nr:FtsX-like permease family protein [Lachnospiraceae bacterium]